MKKNISQLTKHQQIASIHFDVDSASKTVKVPDNFKISMYPARTQKAIHQLQKQGFHIQTTIN